MNSQKYRITLNRKEFLYVLFYANIVLRYCIFTYVNLKKDYNIDIPIILIELILAVAIFCMSAYSIKQLLIIAGICGLGGLVMLCSGQPTIFLTVMAICLAKEVNFDKVVLTDFIFKILILTGTILFCQLGYLEPVMVKRYTEKGVVVRSSLGFTHPNIIGMILSLIVFDYLYLFYQKLGWKSFFFLIGIESFFFRFTDSRTSLLIAIFIILLTYISKNKKIQNVILWGLPYMFGALVIGSYLMSYFYRENSFFLKIDDIATGRIKLGKIYMELYRLSLFGQDIVFGETPLYPLFSLTLDNLYLRLLINFGVIYTLFIIVGYYRAGKHLYRERNIKAAILCIASAIYGLSEGIGFNICFNLSLFLLSDWVYKKNKREAL